jgi:hypothetical protein
MARVNGQTHNRQSAKRAALVAGTPHGTVPERIPVTSAEMKKERLAL